MTPSTSTRTGADGGIKPTVRPPTPTAGTPGSAAPSVAAGPRLGPRLEPQCHPASRPHPGSEHLHLNTLVAVALFLASVLTMTLSGMTGIYGDPPRAWVSLLLLACTTLPLAARFTHPWQSLLVVALGFGLAGELGVQEFMVLPIALFVALYSEGAWDADRRRAAWIRASVIVAMFVWLLVTLFKASTDPDLLDALPSDSAGWSLSPLVAFMLVQLVNNAIYFAAAYWSGDRAWRSTQDREALEELARQLSAQRRRAEQQAVALERVRIARELHDAVAHHVSLIGVQASAARLALDRRPDGAQIAREALLGIEESSRSAVDDMHAILRTLRNRDQILMHGGDGGNVEDLSEPTASLGVERLPDLVLESTAAGLSATFTEVGAPTPLPPLVSLNLYRVAQEALTNVRRHGGPGTIADVRLRHGADWVELEVANGRPPHRLGRARSGRSGLGLIGMRERVESDGGHIEAGALSSGGWVVRARVPLRGDQR